MNKSREVNQSRERRITNSRDKLLEAKFSKVTRAPQPQFKHGKSLLKSLEKWTVSAGSKTAVWTVINAK